MKAQKLSQLVRYYQMIKNSEKLAENVKLQIALLQVDIVEESVDMTTIEYV